MDTENLVNSDSKLTLTNESFLTITNVVKVVEAKPNYVILKLKNKQLDILGNNLEIKKLDTATGYLEIEGTITSLKYSSARDTNSFLKKLFK